MTAKVYSSASIGFDGKLIEVECDMTNGLPGIIIVGLANKAIDEAKERIRSGLKNSDLLLPRKRVTLNLAPADLPKDGALYDLPMALAILVCSEQIKNSDLLQRSLFVGELSLDGMLRPIHGAITHAETARQHGFDKIFTPTNNAKQAGLIDGLEVYPVQSIRQLVAHFAKPCIEALVRKPIRARRPKDAIDFSEVYGQTGAKRALEIAVAGHHNVLMNGPPGAGKTMMAKAMLSIIPDMTSPDIVSTTKLHSLAGELIDGINLSRPFRSPHHSASSVSLVGGGRNPKPGEISLAHKGILFLDEIPEYPRSCLEALRQPLEDKLITISRATDTVVFPADFMLVATQNPCPCGFYLDPDHNCSCTPHQINQYSRRLSGPLIDRIDLIVNVQKVAHKHLLSTSIGADNSATIRQRIEAARYKQQQRFGSGERLNTHMRSREFVTIGGLTNQAKQFLELAAAKLALSARSYMKVIRVARTIADLAGSESINQEHLAEALLYRPRTSNI